MGRLTTHVLDAVAGRPAEGVAVTLYHIAPEGARAVFSGATDADGRIMPILEGEAFVAGLYELHFQCAAYFRGRGVPLADPPFLDTVPIRFGIADAGQHVHVPLLLSPHAYSTYRGS